MDVNNSAGSSDGTNKGKTWVQFNSEQNESESSPRHLHGNNDANHAGSRGNAQEQGSTSPGGNQTNAPPGFSNMQRNGDVIVSIEPVNTRWPWATRASFQRTLVPQELMAPGITLTVDEYAQAMELLPYYVKFNSNAIWLLGGALSVAIIRTILISGAVGITLFALGIFWLISNVAAVYLGIFLRIKRSREMERCLTRINEQLIKHKLIVGINDRGRVSRHRIYLSLCFVYFDSNECIKQLEHIFDGTQTQQEDGLRMQQSDSLNAPEDAEIGGASQNKGQRVYLRYCHRWATDYLNRRLDWTSSSGNNGTNPTAIRHLTSAICPCQYVEEYIRRQAVSQYENPCSKWFPCRKGSQIFI